MTTLTKTFLWISVAGFVSGIVIDFGGFNLNPSWGLTLPAGAIALGLFLVSLALEKEMAGFDAEQAEKLRHLQPAKSEGRLPEPTPAKLNLSGRNVP